MTSGKARKPEAAETLEATRERIADARPEGPPGRKGIEPGEKLFDFALDPIGHNGQPGRLSTVILAPAGEDVKRPVGWHLGIGKGNSRAHNERNQQFALPGVAIWIRIGARNTGGG